MQTELLEMFQHLSSAAGCRSSSAGVAAVSNAAISTLELLGLWDKPPQSFGSEGVSHGMVEVGRDLGGHLVRTAQSQLSRAQPARQPSQDVAGALQRLWETTLKRLSHSRGTLKALS